MNEKASVVERIAITLVFFANGLGIGAWAASLPHFKRAFGLSDGALSLALLAFAVGAVASMPLVGLYAPRFGTGRATRVAALTFSLALLLPNATTGLLSLAVSAAVLGATNGCIDVLMNSHASDVERRWGMPIMSSIHAAFSTGGLAGAGLGSLLASMYPGTNLVLPVAAFVATLLGVVTWTTLGRGATAAVPVTAADPPPAFAWPERSALPLCAAALACMLCEGAMADWTAVYLTSAAAAGPAVAGAGYAAFSAAMLVGRLGGDRIVGAMGTAGVVGWGGGLAGVGLALAAGVPALVPVTIGFALVGFGLANVIPVLFSAAGRLGGSGLATRGIAMVATAGYAGFLTGPPLVGATATFSGLRWGLALLAIVAAALALLAPFTATMVRRQSQQANEGAETTA